MFDPLQEYGSFSYADFFLYPLADALSQAISPTTQVFFAMQASHLASQLSPHMKIVAAPLLYVSGQYICHLATNAKGMN